MKKFSIFILILLATSICYGATKTVTITKVYPKEDLFNLVKSNTSLFNGFNFSSKHNWYEKNGDSTKLIIEINEQTDANTETTTIFEFTDKEIFNFVKNNTNKFDGIDLADVVDIFPSINDSSDISIKLTAQ